MDIRRIAINNVTELLEIEIVHADYKGQVAKRINEKMPLATVKGFRKGAVPKDLVEKQYGKAIKQEEVKKVVDLAIERFVANERYSLLGTPIAIEKEIFNWEQENLTFQFEIGIVPKFEINLDEQTPVTKYVVSADDSIIEEQVVRIQKQFGTTNATETITKNTEVTATFINEDAGINAKQIFEISIFKEETQALFLNKKVNETLTIATDQLFEEDEQMLQFLDQDTLDVVVNLEVNILEINNVEPANLDQELFDKLFGEGNVATLEELKEKIKQDAESQFQLQAEQKLEDDVISALIENTKFDLPKDFLIKWMQNSGQKKLNLEEATVEYNRSENGLRFQLIEGKAYSQIDVKVNFEELKSFTANAIRQQMAQFGQQNPTEAEVDAIVARVLANQEEVQKLTQQVSKQKLVKAIVEKANPVTKEVTYNQFVAEIYGK
jgi:trigger factor